MTQSIKLYLRATIFLKLSSSRPPGTACRQGRPKAPAPHAGAFTYFTDPQNLWMRWQASSRLAFEVA
jgi:hypothetical protein